MNCPICNQYFKSIRGLMPHIKVHGYTSKSLYDQFKKKDYDGLCECCKKETKYINYMTGYQKFCSIQCSNNTIVKKYWDSNSESVIERKNKQRERFKKYQNVHGRPKGSKNKNPYPKTPEVLSRKPPNWKGKMHDKKTKEKMSATRSLKIKNGEIKIMASYKGRFTPKNTKKYIGDVQNIIYRSLWERKYMKYLDSNASIIEWASEEISIKYYDPTSKKIRRYFPDFFVKEKLSDGTIKSYLVEIKPKRQTAPPQKPKRQTKGYLYEVMEYAKNQSKWEVAKEYCADRGWEFRVLTEDDLNIRY